MTTYVKRNWSEIADRTAQIALKGFYELWPVIQNYYAKGEDWDNIISVADKQDDPYLKTELTKTKSYYTAMRQTVTDPNEQIEWAFKIPDYDDVIAIYQTLGRKEELTEGALGFVDGALRRKEDYQAAFDLCLMRDKIQEAVQILADEDRQKTFF